MFCAVRKALLYRSAARHSSARRAATARRNRVPVPPRQRSCPWARPLVGTGPLHRLSAIFRPADNRDLSVAIAYSAPSDQAFRAHPITRLPPEGWSNVAGTLIGSDRNTQRSSLNPARLEIIPPWLMGHARAQGFHPNWRRSSSERSRRQLRGPRTRASRSDAPAVWQSTHFKRGGARRWVLQTWKNRRNSAGNSIGSNAPTL